MNEPMAARDMQQMRLAMMITRTLDTLRGTIRLRARRDAPVVIASADEVKFEVEAELTDDSERVIAPLVVKADMLGALQAKHLAALRSLVLDYIGKPGYIEEFHRVIQGDTVTIEELMLVVHETADHAEMVERSLR